MTRIRRRERENSRSFSSTSSSSSVAATGATKKRRNNCIGGILLFCVLNFNSVQTVEGNIDYSSASNYYQQHEREQSEDQRYLSEYHDHHRHHYDHYHSESYYTRYESKPSRISDIWVCLACALGWTVWFLSMTQRPSFKNESSLSSIFDRQESKTVMGHVLQVTLGEDSDGAGIPVYHAVVDYVVESPTVDEEPLQVRKCFTTEKLLEEGFANVEVLYCVQDPTTSILFEDYIDDKNNRYKNQNQHPGTMWYIGIYMVVAILIGSSFIGAAHAIQHLEEEQQQMGWISLVVGVVFLYPTAFFVYLILNRTSRAASQIMARRGEILHGAVQKFDCSGCGAIMDPMEIMNDIPTPSTTNQIQNPASFRLSKSYSRQGGGQSGVTSSYSRSRINGVCTPTSFVSTRSEQQQQHLRAQSHDTMTTAPKSPLYPNAGCGFGNYNIHMPTYHNGSNVTCESSVSSISSSDQTPTSQATKKKQQQLQAQQRLKKQQSNTATTGSSSNSNNSGSKTPPPPISTGATTLVARIDSSKLEKYEKGLEDSGLMLPK